MPNVSFMRAHRRVPVLVLAAMLLGVPAGTALATTAAAPTAAARNGSHQPKFMRTLSTQWLRSGGAGAISPPAPPCPLPDNLPKLDVPQIGSIGVGPCVMGPQPPAIGQPLIGNMAYWGGRVQVHPHLYLIYLGWGRPGAFTGDCAPVHLREGRLSATLRCDPDGAGKHMADFAAQLGGTAWAGLQSQYYQVVNGVKTFVANDRDQLAGIWVDDVSPTSAKITYRQMAQEAERAAAHFHVPARQLVDSNFVILQPQKFSDPAAQASGYCAFHDFIEPAADPKDYSGLMPGVPYTNLPYVLNQGGNCGQNLVNKGAAGRLDGTTLALGHEIEETVTDPGAGDHIKGVALGGWYDPFEASENGDKCAYVGLDPTGLVGTIHEPGAGADITGNRGGQFAVQSLWSNAAAAGAGYCAGAGTDLPF